MRIIFRSYLKLGSLNLLMADLHKQGIVTKVRTLKTGETVARPTAFDGAAVLGTVKAKLLRVVAEEATSLDSSCARRLRVGDEETSFHIEQRS